MIERGLLDNVDIATLSAAIRNHVGTVASDVSYPEVVPVTGVTVKTADLGWERSSARFSLEIATAKHQQSHFDSWANRTSTSARLSVGELLDKLAELGFAWRDLAQLLGVSVQALQKWRRGGPATADNRHKLAGMVAACELISDECAISEVASWFEVPIYPGVPIRPLDLWAARRPDLVFDYASGHADAEATLATFDPEWRDRYRSAFETFRAGDGQLALRMKDR